MDLKDVRIEETRQAIHQWLGRGKATHLPTGLIIEYVISWADESDKLRALKELGERAAKAWQYGSAA